MDADTAALVDRARRALRRDPADERMATALRAVLTARNELERRILSGALRDELRFLQAS